MILTQLGEAGGNRWFRPDHIDDLPRRDEDNRPPMFGLIDDSPQEAEAPASLVMWALGLAVAVVLFVVLVWVMAPSS